MGKYEAMYAMTWNIPYCWTAPHGVGNITAVKYILFCCSYASS